MANVEVLGEKNFVIIGAAAESDGMITDEEEEYEPNDHTAVMNKKSSSQAGVGPPSVGRCWAMISTRRAQRLAENCRRGRQAKTTTRGSARNGEKRRHWTSPWALLLYFLLAMALFLGLILGLNDNGTTNKNTPPVAAAATAAAAAATTTETSPPPPIINVLIEFDDNPEQVGWSIIDQDTWAVVYEAKQGAYYSGVSSSRFVNEEVVLEWDQDYIFRISDSGLDGLSVGKEGKFLLVYQDTEFASCTGNWDGEDVVAFSIKQNEELPTITGRGQCFQ